ncbi:hypothetical protein C7974DRAFT_389351 [Boeremia exigua]|uniref:uncharacterized protein n=1 Tax=Boeremia exigua TaxID=749465 RepID=UPI001E8DC2CF|nr:uncharacterized protein C7974DRAFT_389351 [Boeremia exigua]KAH6639883.1 hypothetical protein C7974DRAFT_389351 [Boeremia exigua]
MGVSQSPEIDRSQLRARVEDVVMEKTTLEGCRYAHQLEIEGKFNLNATIKSYLLQLFNTYLTYHTELPSSLSSPIMSSTTSGTLRARIEATARSFLASFEDGGNQNDSSLVNRDVTASCTRHFLPASVAKAFGFPVDFSFDTATFEQAFAKDIKVLSFKSNVISNLVIDTETLRASFTSFAEVEVKKTGESYSVEQAWVLYLTEDGLKVSKVIEFCDKDALLKMASASTQPE